VANVITEECVGCGACEHVCPSGGISRAEKRFVIDPSRCSECVGFYHAQQCAEKCLKAYLVFKGVDFPFTHNISALLELCSPSAEWAEELDDAKALSAYAITARYPGTYKVTKKDALQAVEIAEHVRAAIRKSLKEEGLKMAPSRI